MPSVAFDVAQACQTSAAEIALCWERAFDKQVELATLPTLVIESGALPEALAKPGLLVQIAAGNQRRYLAAPHIDAILPSWYRAPDATGASKLTTLAQELGMLLFPDDLLPEVYSAAFVPQLEQALIGELNRQSGLQCLPLRLTAFGHHAGEAYLIWPPASAAAIPPVPPQPSAALPPQQPKAVDKPRPALRNQPGDTLPPYARSLLRIRVPVSVTLARKKQIASQVLELGPGAIIQFDRSCDETLELEVGGRCIAQGEAVKVGDKFGLRITDMVNPGEQFRPIARNA